MATKNETFSFGFILTETKLRGIHESLIKQLQPITDTVTSSYTLKYISGIEVERSDIDVVFQEKNGEERKIQVLTIILKGTKNNNEIADISLKFEAKPPDPISYHISCNDEVWLENTIHILEFNINKVRKNISFNSLAKITEEMGTFGILPLITSTTQTMTASIFRILGNSFIPDYNFCWGEYLRIYNERAAFRRYILNVIFVGVVIAFFVSTLGGILANFISYYWLHIGQGH